MAGVGGVLALWHTAADLLVCRVRYLTAGAKGEHMFTEHMFALALEGVPMGQAVLASDEVAQLSELLRQVGRAGSSTSPSVQANATFWADAMARRPMGQRDLQRIAWLLRKISDSGESVPRAHRRNAGYWAAYLRAQL
jgi:hypothetical protein